MKLYRLAWFGDTDGEQTKELGFVLANNDEEAMGHIPNYLEAGAFGRGGWNADAFFTAEEVTDADRLANLLEWSLSPHLETNIAPSTFQIIAEAMLKSAW